MLDVALPHCVVWPALPQPTIQSILTSNGVPLGIVCFIKAVSSGVKSYDVPVSCFISELKRPKEPYFSTRQPVADLTEKGDGEEDEGSDEEDDEGGDEEGEDAPAALVVLLLLRGPW